MVPGLNIINLFHLLHRNGSMKYHIYMKYIIILLRF